MKTQNSIKQSTSLSLIRFAWFLEILFCLTGIFIAFALSFSGLGINSVNEIDPLSLIGFLLLFAIAAVELTKIPMVKTFTLTDSLKNKTVAGSFLAVACLLTFYTMSVGMTQNVENRDHNLNQAKLSLIELKEERDLVSQNIKNISNRTKGDIKKEFDESLRNIDETIEGLRSEEKRLQISNNFNEISSIDDKINSINMQIQSSRETYKFQIEDINEEITKINTNEQNELSKALFKSSINKRYQERRQSKEKEKESLTAEFNENIQALNAQIDNLETKKLKISQLDPSTLQAVKSLRQQIADLQKDKKELVGQVSLNMREELSKIKQDEIRIIELKEKKRVIEDELQKARNEFAHLSQSSTTYKLAQNLHGVENASDLESSQINFVKNFYIFSIALIVAISGPLMAYISVRTDLETKAKRERNIGRSFRVIFRAALKRLRKPKIITEIKEIEIEKEIIKEIPVEKEVYKKVEVPVPYEVTKYVGVPVPTDPRDLPKRTNSDKHVDSLVSKGVPA